MTIAAGELDRRITFKRGAAPTSDAYNEGVIVWAALGTFWARVRWGTGSERRATAQETSEQAATFTVRSNPKTRDVTLTDRIAFDRLDWNIRSIARPNRTDIEITATTVAREVPE